ncbi:TPA: hypothetical protein KQJ63_000569 [Clostridioides difficile]|nr:hypothetical protein [Clostridioides difficile]MDN9297806.1 hypothetical protein [Clostridioides difficile]HAT4772230.1 hypothetical protein [Clostridioides difficile]HAT4775456.1 hypothetical protein [Clostridioides difficile]HAT4833379.1 hypothetical protein [Clostridioides difficile]
MIEYIYYYNNKRIKNTGMKIPFLYKI